MKKIILAVVASAAALAGTSAFADEAGSAYVGVGAVGSKYEFNAPGAVSGENHSGYKTGAKVYGGYNIDQTWAVEGGYTDFGKKSYNYTAAGLPGGVRSDAHSYYLAGKGTWPVNQQIALTGKLGVARNTNEVSTSGIASVNGDKNKTALYAAVGAEYAINNNVKVSLEYEHYGKNDIDTGRKSGAVTAGLRYAF